MCANDRPIRRCTTKRLKLTREAKNSQMLQRSGSGDVGESVKHGTICAVETSACGTLTRGVLWEQERFEVLFKEGLGMEADGTLSLEDARQIVMEQCSKIQTSDFLAKLDVAMVRQSHSRLHFVCSLRLTYRKSLFLLLPVDLWSFYAQAEIDSTAGNTEIQELTQRKQTKVSAEQRNDWNERRTCPSVYPYPRCMISRAACRQAGHHSRFNKNQRAAS